jgi:hypothetical protein
MEKKKYHPWRWTQEEDDVLTKAIIDSPHNKQQAFRNAAEKLLIRDTKACENRWYQSLSNPKSQHYVGCVFTMISRTSRLDNRVTLTNSSHQSPKRVGLRLWNTIKKLLHI